MAKRLKEKQKEFDDDYHSTNSPSALGRRRGCPGSRAVESLIEDSPTTYSDEGSIAHAVIEELIENPMRNIPHLIESVKKTKKRWQKFEVDYDDMGEACLTWVQHIMALACDVEMIEQRVDLSDYDLEENSGTADFIGYRKSTRTLYVRDYKHGSGVFVEAKDNPQILAYALGAVLDFEFLFDVDQVDYGIVQPRMENEQSHVLPVTHLIEWGDDWLRPTLAATWDEDAPLNPGDWCQFCKAAGECPALLQRTKEVAIQGFAQEPEVITVRDAKLVSVEEMATILYNATAIQTFIKEIETRVFHQSKSQPGSVPGYKVVLGNAGVRKWTDEGKAKTRALQAAEETFTDVNSLYTPAKLKSLAQIEKVFGKGLFEEYLNEFVTRPPAKPTLALESDERPAIENPAFMPVDDDKTNDETEI